MVCIEDLKFSYKQKSNPLFSQLSLNLKGGDVCGLLGMNGAGKSTLLKLICGGLFPDQGDIQVLNFESRKRNPLMLQEIFYLPEEFVMPDISGWDYQRIYNEFYPSFDSQKMDDLCTELEVDRKKKLHKLSHGQRKKYLLAFGLASNARLTILDEPSNGLDIPSKTLFRKLVAGSVTDDKVIIISTHQVKDVETLIDPVVILHEGKVLFRHSMEEISEKLAFHRSSTPPDGSEFYGEMIPGGYGLITRGPGEGAVDLELLFNAIIEKGDILGGSYE